MVSAYKLQTPPRKKDNWLDPTAKTQEEWEEDYSRLFEELALLANEEEAGEHYIKDEVYQVAVRLMEIAKGAGRVTPKIFSHGPDSVVFNWKDGATEVYATISADTMAILMSGPNGITHRSTHPLFEKEMDHE
jgi:phage repressor protein C with HTH and peptisase S24 domain